MANPEQPGFEQLTGYQVLRSCETEHQHTVWLLKHKRYGFFAVQYGEQRKERLDYMQAAHELGECLMHQLQCAGELD
jgi:hypothetical protein